MWVVEDLTRLAGAQLVRLRQEIVPGSALAKPIDISRLICPLRYDLWVRIDLVRLLRDEPELYREDFSGFLSRPPARAYHVWFKEVCCGRFRPRLYRNPKLLERAFVQRIRETAALQESIDRHGFDGSKPIRLMSGRSIRTVNGKRIGSRYFAGDGCHRMACLYASGRTSLEPAEYEVAIHPSFQPLDNTSILIRHLPLDRTAYLRFISSFYCDGDEIDSADGILRHVAGRRPELLPELRSVLASDLPRVTKNE